VDDEDGWTERAIKSKADDDDTFFFSLRFRSCCSCFVDRWGIFQFRSANPRGINANTSIHKVVVHTNIKDVEEPVDMARFGSVEELSRSRWYDWSRYSRARDTLAALDRVQEPSLAKQSDD
jgi:hypothetical protein